MSEISRDMTPNWMLLDVNGTLEKEILNIKYCKYLIFKYIAQTFMSYEHFYFSLWQTITEFECYNVCKHLITIAISYRKSVTTLFFL